MTSIDWCTIHLSKENPARTSVCLYASEHVVFEHCQWESSEGERDPEKWMWEEETGPMTIEYEEDK